MSISRDERSTPNGDTARFTTIRTFPGQAGYYITSGKMAAGAGSDFADVANRRVVDKACRLANQALFQFLNADLRVNAIGGTLFEADARTIEDYVDGIVRTNLVNRNEASDVRIVVDRVSNVLSTKTIPVTVRVIPKGYANFISADVGLLNPALQVV